MVFFDYGQTLINETAFDPEKGIQAVLDTAAVNPRKLKAEDLMESYRGLVRDINAPQAPGAGIQYIEVPDALFQHYLYGYYGICLTKDPREIELIFERNAHEAVPSPGISDFLAYLDQRNIRTGVISNISYSGETVRTLLEERIPGNHFEEIVASSDVIFRKPHPRIFQYALAKAGIPASKAIFCGDNPAVDIDGASACGIFPVWYRGCCRMAENLVPRREHLEVGSWKELERAMEDRA